MGLKVIGVGLGRTGSVSLKAALAQLGIAPCHHMTEVLAHPGTADGWLAALEGAGAGVESLLSRYVATMDWPSLAFWRRTISAYPDAKVILTTRDVQSWFESIETTILRRLRASEALEWSSLGSQRQMALRAIRDVTFHGNIHDARHVRETFLNHNEAVRRAVPKARLLEFSPGNGWEPLCRFLDRPVPKKPFPRTNGREEFWDRIKAVDD